MVLIKNQQTIGKYYFFYASKYIFTEKRLKMNRKLPFFVILYNVKNKSNLINLKTCLLLYRRKFF